MSVPITYYLERKGSECNMSMPSHLWINGMWERIDSEICKQNKSKSGIAKRCGFKRSTLNGDYNISLPNLAKLCKELDVSADYLLFGK